MSQFFYNDTKNNKKDVVMNSRCLTSSFDCMHSHLLVKCFICSRKHIMLKYLRQFDVILSRHVHCLKCNSFVTHDQVVHKSSSNYTILVTNTFLKISLNPS